MYSISDLRTKSFRRVNSSKLNGDVSEPTLNDNDDTEAKKRAILVEWLNNTFPNIKLPLKASDKELRACLIDGAILGRILTRLRPGSLDKGDDPDYPSASRSEIFRRFLATMDEMGIPSFEMADLEKGSMKPVIDGLLAVRGQFTTAEDNSSITSTATKSESPHGDGSSQSHLSPLSGEERRKILSESKFQRALRSPVMTEPSAALLHHVGHKFHEVFQMKQGRYADLPAAKISEMMKSNSLDNAPTQSLLSVVNGILDESVERNNGEIPHRVACLLRKVVQEIERRISTQAEHLRTQNNLFKAREEKYQSRISVLETLASGTGEETQIARNPIQQLKTEKTQMEEKKKLEDDDVAKLLKEKEERNLEISTLKQELEATKKAYEVHCLQMETEAKSAKANLDDKLKEKEDCNLEISTLKQELETTKKTYEVHCLQMETDAKSAKANLEDKLKEFERLLVDSRNKVKELEAYSESRCQGWNKKEFIYRCSMDFQFGVLRELRLSSESIKREILKTQKCYSEEFNHLGREFKTLAHAAESYNAVLAENRKLFNEIQELKGNIRVYCRVRPFLPGQSGKKTIVEHIGETGELVVANPSKPGKDGHRLFRFNKIFGPAATQAEVFSDIQPFIRSVLDGYNVCIFAYGQTGSGKTYTMTGPIGASEKDWGVNYRALNDLFNISLSRKVSLTYEVGVQMVEIYNEQVRDLLSSNVSQKILGIISTSQPNGLAVPDATMQPVTSTSDVLELMEIGLKNRAMSATAMNERSSRSHSIVTIHVRGKDLTTGAVMHGNLHLVDLAGSERVDRSEVTGDRLKEAQHINKSLSALGDVIFALAQKSNHVPYRNSKLTHVLQSSLGGHAKTLMFVQLNPDASSYTESFSTLKFAERVSGVELGTARSSKEGRDVRELMEQMASLKDTIAKKDEEIERLQLVKDLKNVYPSRISEKLGMRSFRYGSSSPGRDSLGGAPLRSPKPSSGKVLGHTEKAASDHDNFPDHSDKHSESDSQQSVDDFKQDIPTDIGIIESGEEDCEDKHSDVSDGILSVGTEADSSTASIVSSECVKPSVILEKSKTMSKVLRHIQKPEQTVSTTITVTKDSTKPSTSIKKFPSSSSLLKPPRRS